MLKLFATTAAVALLTVASPVLAQSQSPSTNRPAAGAPATTNAPAQRQADKKEVDRGDRKFMENAAEGGMKEVALGKLAQQKAQDPQVKQLAEMIVKDHEEANKKLMSLASTMGVDLKKATEKDHKKELDDYQKASGADFDKKYVDAMVKDHRKDVKEFEEASKNAKNPQLKAFAGEVAPKLKQHLQMAEAAQKSLQQSRQPQTSRGPSDKSGAAGTSAPSGAAPSGGTAPKR